MSVCERLKAKAEGVTHFPYTRLRWGLEHLKIETRLINARFASVMGEYVFLKRLGAPSMLRLTRKSADLERMFPTFDLN